MFHEPDTSQNANPHELAKELFPSTVPGADDDASEPLRFSIAQMLAATAVAAIFLALFRTFGVWGAVLSFMLALIATLFPFPQIGLLDRRRKVLIFDFVWGVVMPVVCLVFDPFVFKGSENLDILETATAPGFDAILDAAYFAYPALALQVAAMMAVLAAGRLPAPGAAFVAGVLFLGLLVAGGIGLMLLPLSTMGLIVLIGMLGYTPLFTAWAFGRRVRKLWAQAREGQSWQKALAIAVLGLLLAAAVPIAIGWPLLVLRREREAGATVGFN